MSTLKVNAIRGTGASSDAISVNSTDGTCTAKITNPPPGNRNLIIGGAMQVAQRGTSFSGVTSSTTTYPVDRFLFGSSGSSAWTVAQSTAGSVLANTGFSYAIKVDCTTADTSLGATNEFWVTQKIEAQDLQHLRWGNAAAKSLTLSFWTRSNKTGDYGVWCYAEDGARQYATTYTISSADTWEKKVITIPGDTSGTINNDNGTGFEVRFYLGAGSSYAGTPSSTWTGTLDNRTTTLNLADNTANEWYLTGVQLEVSDHATDFEHRSYGDELQRCMRYYVKYMGPRRWPFINGHNSNTQGFTNFQYPVKMRAAPTVTFGSEVGIFTPQVSVSQTITSASAIGVDGFTTIRWVGQSGLGTHGDAKYGMILNDSNANSYIETSAEL